MCSALQKLRQNIDRNLYSQSILTKETLRDECFVRIWGESTPRDNGTAIYLTWSYECVVRIWGEHTPRDNGTAIYLTWSHECVVRIWGEHTPRDNGTAIYLTWSYECVVRIWGEHTPRGNGTAIYLTWSWPSLFYTVMDSTGAFYSKPCLDFPMETEPFSCVKINHRPTQSLLMLLFSIEQALRSIQAAPRHVNLISLRAWYITASKICALMILPAI